MKVNMGKADRLIRLIVAVIFAALYFGNVVVGTLGLVMVILAAFFTVTSLLRICILYLPFGANTCSLDEV